MWLGPGVMRVSVFLIMMMWAPENITQAQIWRALQFTTRPYSIFWTWLATGINKHWYKLFNLVQPGVVSTFRRSISLLQLILCLFCVTMCVALIKYQAYKYFPCGLFMRSSFHTGSWQFVRVKSSCSQFYSRLFTTHTTGVWSESGKDRGTRNKWDTNVDSLEIFW